MSEELQKQEPEIPKKKEKKQGGGGLSLPMMIVFGVGGLVLVLVAVIFGYFIATKLFPSQPVIVQGVQPVEQVHKENHGKGEGEEEKPDMHDLLYMEIGRLTTNPKDAPSTFVVVNLSFEFAPKKKDDENMKELIKGHEGLNLEHPIVKKMQGRIKSGLNNFLASMTMTELNTKRPELQKLVLELLKPAFKEYGFKLYNVSLLEFIIQE